MEITGSCVYTSVRLKTKNMIFTGNTSFIYIVLFIIIYNSLSMITKNKKLSNPLLMMGNIIVLTGITSINSIGILLTTSALVFFFSRFLNKNKKHNKLYLSLFIGILILLFVIKNYNIADLELLHRVGLSYILFRLIHFLVDSANNKIQEYNLITFLNYIIFFPNFIT